MLRLIGQCKKKEVLELEMAFKEMSVEKKKTQSWWELDATSGNVY